MTHCSCSETSRCPEAHTLRDQYQAARTFEVRVEVSQRYTQHLYDAGLMAYPTTASPTWHCEAACEPYAPCRAETFRDVIRRDL